MQRLALSRRAAVLVEHRRPCDRLHAQEVGTHGRRTIRSVATRSGGQFGLRKQKRIPAHPTFHVGERSDDGEESVGPHVAAHHRIAHLGERGTKALAGDHSRTPAAPPARRAATGRRTAARQASSVARARSHRDTRTAT